MDVVCLLPSPLLTQLRIALGREHRLLEAQDWVHLDELIRRNPVDVAVLDPGATGATSAAEVIALRARYPSLPVVPYVVLTPPALRAMVELARHGVQQVVLHRFDDEPARLREVVLRQAGDALTEQMLERLAGTLARLPVPLAEAVRQLFRTPQRFLSAHDLVRRSGMPRRTMYRQLMAAGISSPRMLVQAARVLRAYVYLGDPGVLVEDVAAKLGYGSPRILVRHARETTAVIPSALRRRVAPDELVAMLERRLLVATSDSACEA